MEALGVVGCGASGAGGATGRPLLRFSLYIIQNDAVLILFLKKVIILIEPDGLFDSLIGPSVQAVRPRFEVIPIQLAGPDRNCGRSSLVFEPLVLSIVYLKIF